MDFSNEHYVRLYTRDTTTWLRLGWDAQCVFGQVLRKMDMAGVMDIDGLEPWEAVVVHCRAPEDVARRGMARCLELGVLEHNGSYLVAPKYIEANTASKSDKQRQKEHRNLRRAKAMSRNVTSGHENDGDERADLDDDAGEQGDGATPDDDPSDPVETGESQGVSPTSQNVTKNHSATDPVTAGHKRSLFTSPSSVTSTVPGALPTRVRAREANVPKEAKTLSDRIRAARPLVDPVALADDVAIYLHEQGLHRFDVMKWREDLQWIGDQPIADLALVLHHALADRWVQENLHVVDPGHLRKRWVRYRGGPPKAVVDARKTADDERHTRMRRRAELETKHSDALMRAEGFGDPNASEESKGRAAREARDIEQEIAKLEAESRGASKRGAA